MQYGRLPDLVGSLVIISILHGFSIARAVDPIGIHSRRELFVDDYLIDRMEGVELRMHKPTPRGVVIVHDESWEGNSCGYHTIFRDGDLYRMYYKAAAQVLQGEPAPHRLLGCYAESSDGIHWKKPNLGLFEFHGSKDNNIVWDGPGSHDFTPFLDPNPDCSPDAKYKAVANAGGVGGGLLAFKSIDGIHWSRLVNKPVITKGAFDTQNLAFWDSCQGEYRAYIRDFRDGRRDIRTATSSDFIHWTDPQWLEFPGAPREQLYTNQISPYYRAPHIYLGFPTRYIDRGWSMSMRALPGLEHRKLRSRVSPREGTALTDGLFMTSRDGRSFHRWSEAFLRPGLRPRDNWVYGDNYQNWGLVETNSAIDGAPNDLSLYATESYWTGHGSQLRRFTIRIDGFVSVHAAGNAGRFDTRPLIFEGNKLTLNFSTSAAGSIRVEIQDVVGEPLKGFAVDDCDELFGDTLEGAVTWKGSSDLSQLADKPVRLRFVLRDADLYSMQFQNHVASDP